MEIWNCKLTRFNFSIKSAKKIFFFHKNIEVITESKQGNVIWFFQSPICLSVCRDLYTIYIDHSLCCHNRSKDKRLSGFMFMRWISENIDWLVHRCLLMFCIYFYLIFEFFHPKYPAFFQWLTLKKVLCLKTLHFSNLF